MTQLLRISEVKKRDGRIVRFEPAKITNAIHKAFLAIKGKDEDTARKLSDQVVSVLGQRFAGKVPSVENVQDLVEEILIKNGFADVAKAYILYRQKRTEIREAKKLFGVKDELKLSVNAVSVLRRRYLLKNEKGEIIETPSQLFRRVAKSLAAVDRQYDKNANLQIIEEQFYQAMANLEFLPNSPTLMNAGTEIGQLAACFVLPVEDSLTGIFEAVRNMALIQQSGGGTGFAFSRLRPKGDIVRSTMGVASGPVSFMRVFDSCTDVVKQGGRRRGANMAILRVDHPDIMEFIGAKEREGFLTNFNLSVAVTDKFMKAVERDEEYGLINPRIGKPVKKLHARDVFRFIVTMSWRTGDPGLVFLDEINRNNPTPKIGMIESTNPCGEQPLLPNESCNLGSVNLTKMVKEKDVNWERLRRTIRLAVHFLDNVIDANKYPLKEIEIMTKSNRKIGVGVMGFADMLVQLGIPYNSERALDLGRKIMRFILSEARKKSVELAEKRGAFPNFQGSVWQRRHYKTIRNATLTTVAPTGTISIIADCSSGIEPLFAISYVRNVMDGTKLLEVNPYFEKTARDRGFYSSDLMMKIARKGTIQDIDEIPQDVRKVFVTAFDIPPEWHVKMQAAFQEHTDNAVSKTINFSADARIEDVEKAYMLAYRLKCKGITVYRYGSKKDQVLYVGSDVPQETGTPPGYVSVDSEYSGGCPTVHCSTI